MIAKIVKRAKVINRTYGRMYLLVGPSLNERYHSDNLDVKMLEILPGYKTSYHYHDNIENIFIVLSGKLLAKINDNILLLKKGDYILIKPYVKHQFINNFDNKSFIMEIMTPPYTKEHTIYEENGGAYYD